MNTFPISCCSEAVGLSQSQTFTPNHPGGRNGFKSSWSWWEIWNRKPKFNIPWKCSWLPDSVSSCCSWPAVMKEHLSDVWNVGQHLERLAEETWETLYDAWSMTAAAAGLSFSLVSSGCVHSLCNADPVYSIHLKTNFLSGLSLNKYIIFQGRGKKMKSFTKAENASAVWILQPSWGRVDIFNKWSICFQMSSLQCCSASVTGTQLLVCSFSSVKRNYSLTSCFNFKAFCVFHLSVWYLEMGKCLNVCFWFLYFSLRHFTSIISVPSLQALSFQS